MKGNESRRYAADFIALVARNTVSALKYESPGVPSSMRETGIRATPRNRYSAMRLSLMRLSLCQLSSF